MKSAQQASNTVLTTGHDVQGLVGLVVAVSPLVGALGQRTNVGELT